MSDPLIAPRLLKPDDFLKYASTWKQLVNPQVQVSMSDELTLKQVFTVYGPDTLSLVMNYVYLSNEYAVALLSAVGTVAIQAKFVVASTDAGQPAFAFSIVLFGIDGFGNPTTAYYLAGVASYPAEVTMPKGTELLFNTNETKPSEVGLDLAGNWITNWRTLREEELSIDTPLFNSMYGPVLGYTYPLNDFMNALFPARMKRHSKKKLNKKAEEKKEKKAQSLWLCFALHRHNKPGAIDDFDSYVFSTVLILNDSPKTPSSYDMDRVVSESDYTSGTIDSSDSYYDVSRPSPPY